MDFTGYRQIWSIRITHRFESGRSSAGALSELDLLHRSGLSSNGGRMMGGFCGVLVR